MSPERIPNASRDQPTADLPRLRTVRTDVTALNRREPAFVIAFLVFGLGFVVQVAAGVDVAQALGTAAAISGVQGAATRRNVHSPANVSRKYVPRDGVREQQSRDAIEELERLARLTETKLIDPEEVSAKKKELLARL